MTSIQNSQYIEMKRYNTFSDFLHEENAKLYFVANDNDSQFRSVILSDHAFEGTESTLRRAVSNKIEEGRADDIVKKHVKGRLDLYLQNVRDGMHGDDLTLHYCALEIKKEIHVVNPFNIDDIQVFPNIKPETDLEKFENNIMVAAYFHGNNKRYLPIKRHAQEPRGEKRDPASSSRQPTPNRGGPRKRATEGSPAAERLEFEAMDVVHGELTREMVDSALARIFADPREDECSVAELLGCIQEMTGAAFSGEELLPFLRELNDEAVVMITDRHGDQAGVTGGDLDRIHLV